MLMLSTLHALLSQVLSAPHLHTAVLLTPAGELVSFASEPSRPKDEIRIIVGLWRSMARDKRTRVWDGRQRAFAGQLGRIIVLPVDEFTGGPEQVFSEEHQPLMLIALNATDAVEWEELQTKGKALATHLAKPLSKFRELMTVRKPSPVTTAATSPAPAHM